MKIAFPSNAPAIEKSPPCTYEWEQPSANISLENSIIHIWKIDLNEVDTREDSLQALTAAEKIRAERIIHPEKRRRFQSSRIILRNILSIPHIAQYNLIDPIEFNVTHSENLMLAAFTRCSPVGIDLEKNQPITTKDWIIKQYFTENDHIFFQNMPESSKPEAFLSGWTLKEAYSKAIGDGLASAPKMDHLKQNFLRIPPIGCFEMDQKGAFWFLRFTPQENFSAAAVVRSAVKLQPFFLLFI